jgi:hypothetical protein
MGSKGRGRLTGSRIQNGRAAVKGLLSFDSTIMKKAGEASDSLQENTMQNT